MENVSGINISSYSEDKAAGLVTLAKVGNVTAASIRRFSSKTGTEEDAQLITISLKQLEEIKESITLQLNQLGILISDLKDLTNSEI